MNVLVVDDQRLSRAGIIKMIDWERLGLQLAGECANGHETLDKLANTDVDIVITDVRMPALGGLELIEQAKEHYPQISFIVISGYDDFAYVRRSIQLSVTDYLLKPVDQIELNTLLEKLAEQTKGARLQANIQLQKRREQFLYLLIESAYVQDNLMMADWEEIRLSDQEDHFITAVFDSDSDKNVLQSYFRQRITLSSIFLLRIRGSYVLIAAGSMEELRSNLSMLRNSLSNHKLFQYSGLGTFAMGISNLRESFHNAYDAYTLQASLSPQWEPQATEAPLDSNTPTVTSIPLKDGWEREWFIIPKQFTNGNGTVVGSNKAVFQLESAG